MVSNNRDRLIRYYKALSLHSTGLTISEISKRVCVSRSTLWSWIKRGSRPKDEEALMIGFFSRWVSRNNRDIAGFKKFLYSTSDWVYVAYLYGATITDGSLYWRSGKRDYNLRITGERIFLERVNHVVKQLIGRSYSIRPDKFENRYIITITRKALYELMSYLIHNRKTVMDVIEYNKRISRAFILGLVDGDGGYDPSSNLITFKKSKRKWLTSYSGYLLRKMGIDIQWIREDSRGRVHYTRYGKKIVDKRSRFGWVCDVNIFLRKIGPTIKVRKRRDVSSYIRQLMSRVDDPLD